MNVMIILMYNDSESTIDLLDQVESYPSLDGIVVVDNCSGNNAYEIVKPREKEHIRIIRTETNLGVARGNNFGARFALALWPDTSHLLFSNPDVIVNESSIAAMSDFLDNHPKTGAVCPLEMTSEGTIGRDFAWKLPTYGQMLLSELPLYMQLKSRSSKPFLWYYDTAAAAAQDPFAAEVLISCFIMVSRVAFDAVDGFYERTFLYHEEDIFAWMLRGQGFDLQVLTGVSIVHLGCTTMNKVYKSWKMKSDMLYDSGRVYLKECLRVKPVGLAFYGAVHAWGIFVRRIVRLLTGKGLAS